MTGASEAAELWADWVAIWQSEIAALAADREVQEAVQRSADLWAAQALGLVDEAGRPGAVAPPWPAPAPAPPRDDKRSPAGPGPAAAARD